MKEQNKKQAIEEMKQEINTALSRDCSKARCLTCEYINEENCEPSIITEHLYNAGYRKQSDDTVEIVRCKDCVYFKQSVSALFPHAVAFVCDYPYGLQKNVNGNDFCCHGARMKGGAYNGRK